LSQIEALLVTLQGIQPQVQLGIKKFRAYGVSRGDDSRSAIVSQLEKDNAELKERIENLKKSNGE